MFAVWAREVVPPPLVSDSDDDWDNDTDACENRDFVHETASDTDESESDDSEDEEDIEDYVARAQYDLARAQYRLADAQYRLVCKQRQDLSSFCDWEHSPCARH